MTGSSSSKEINKELKLNSGLQQKQDLEKKKTGVYKNFISGVKIEKNLKKHF